MGKIKKETMVFDLMFFRFPCIFATENSSETHEIEILHKSRGILFKKNYSQI